MSQLRVGSGWFAGVALVVVSAMVACGEDDADPASTGGTAGSAGSGGSAAGTGGGAGAGGTGKGGTSGKGGSGSSATGGHGGGGDGGEAGSGGAAEDAVAFTTVEIEILKTLTPLPAVPPDPTNAFADDPAAAALGQKFFFDEQFSGPLKIDSDLGTAGQVGKVSCASCHASTYLDDDRSEPATVSIGAGVHTRNSPTLVNASFYTWTNWGGRFSAQWELPLAVVESGVIMNGNRLQVAHRIFDVYKAEYEAIFGALEPAIGSAPDRFPAEGKPKPAPTPEVPDPPNGAWEEMEAEDQVIVNRILANYSKAIAAYLRLLVSRNASFDAFMEGADTAMDSGAKRGAKLFVGKARCVNCHNGPQLSDGGFHVLGVPQTGSNVPPGDDGRFKDGAALLGSIFNRDGLYSDKTDTGGLAGLTNPMPENTKKAFRTPGLRGVALTAPYMHSGQIATLEQVIDFYDAGGVPGTSQGLFPLGLTPGEKSDLLAFLESLTGETIPEALLEDTASP